MKWIHPTSNFDLDVELLILKFELEYKLCKCEKGFREEIVHLVLIVEIELLFYALSCEVNFGFQVHTINSKTK